MAAPSIEFQYQLGSRVFSQSSRVITKLGTGYVTMVKPPFQPATGLTPKLYTCDVNGAFWGLTGAYTDFPMWGSDAYFPLGMNLLQFWGFTLNRTGIFDYKYMPLGVGATAKATGVGNAFTLPGSGTQITRGRYGLNGASQSGGGPLQNNCNYFKFRMAFNPVSFTSVDLASSPPLTTMAALLLQDVSHEYQFNSVFYPIRTDHFGEDTWQDPPWYNSLNTQSVNVNLFPEGPGNPVLDAFAAQFVSNAGIEVVSDSVFTEGDSVASGGNGYGGICINPVTGVCFAASFVPQGLPWGSTAMNVYGVANSKVGASVPPAAPPINRPTLLPIELSNATDQAGFSGNGWLCMNVAGGGAIFWQKGASFFYVTDPNATNYAQVYLQNSDGSPYDLPDVNEWGVDLNGVIWSLNGTDTLYWSSGLPWQINIDVPELPTLTITTPAGQCCSPIPWLGSVPA